MVAAVYDWTGFYIGANGGWGSSRNCWTNSRSAAFRSRRLPKVPMTRPAARSVARSAIAGRLAPGCSALKRRATGPTSRAEREPAFAAPSSTTRSRCVRPVHRPGRLCRQQRPVLRQGRCCGDLEHYRYQRLFAGTALDRVTGDDTRWGGTIGAGLEYAFAPNWSFGVEYNHLFMQDRTYNFTAPVAGIASAPTTSAGRRPRHRPHELPLRRPGHRESTDLARPAKQRSPGALSPGLFLWVAGRPVSLRELSAKAVLRSGSV